MKTFKELQENLFDRKKKIPKPKKTPKWDKVMKLDKKHEKDLKPKVTINKVSKIPRKRRGTRVERWTQNEIDVLAKNDPEQIAHYKKQIRQTQLFRSEK